MNLGGKKILFFPEQSYELERSSDFRNFRTLNRHISAQEWNFDMGFSPKFLEKLPLPVYQVSAISIKFLFFAFKTPSRASRLKFPELISQKLLEKKKSFYGKSFGDPKTCFNL